MPHISNEPLPSNHEASFVKAFHEAIQEAANKIAAEEIAAAVKRVEERTRGEVAKIAARVATHMDFRTLGREVVVTVRFPQPNDPNA